MRILAVDVGTSSVKAAVLDVATATPVGRIGRAGYELDHPVPDASELPTDRLWEAVSIAARQATGETAGVEAVGLSTLMPALVLLDGADAPLAPVWTHLDRRARPIARRIWAEAGEEFLATVGNRPLPGGVSALCFRKLADDRPDLAARVRRYLHVNGWLGLKLTGEAAFDVGNASFTGLFGTMTDQQWSPRWCTAFGVEPAWLPPVVCGSTTLGRLRPDAAAALGVPAGLPVKLGTADTSSAMLAANMRPGDLMHVVGTTQVLAVLTDAPRPSPLRLTRLFGVGPSFVHVTHNPVGGAALDWMHDLSFRDQDAHTFFEHTVPAAAERETIVQLDPPFLGGDRLEIEPAYGAFRGLSTATDRLDLLTAVLRAMRAQHRVAFANLGEMTLTGRVILTGGGAEVVRRLLPEYRPETIEFLEEGSLRGVSRLFGPADQSS